MLSYVHVSALAWLWSREAPSCKHDAELLARSYLVPPRFPFGSSFRLVMENRPQSCDLYDGARVHMPGRQNQSICQLFSDGVLMQPEVHTRQVVASFLGDCRMRHTPCSAVDIGANNGWVSGMMLALGVTSLTSVEPTRDLASALRDTVRLNCWDRPSVRVLNSAVTLDEQQEGKEINLRCGWRLYHFSKRYRGKNCTAPLVHVNTVFSQTQYDFVKIDVDGIDGTLMQWLLGQLLAGRLRVDTIFVECTGCDRETLWSFQNKLDYHAYILDNTDERRFLDANGRDIANGFRPFVPPLDAALEERYAQRFLRHVFYVSPNADLDAWQRIISPRARPRGFTYRGRNPTGPREIVFTKQKLAEPEMNELISDKSIRHGRVF